MGNYVRIEVIYGLWAADGVEPLTGGVHDDVEVTPETAAGFAGADAAGVIRILEASKAERALLKGHVQSQEDGEAAYAAAQASGRWEHGNLVNFIVTRKDRLAYDDTLADDDKDKLEAGHRAALEAELAQAEEHLPLVEVPE